MPTPRTEPSFRRYVLALALAWASICAATLAVNLAVDPLWFWKGNQISGVNLAINEREAKINHVAAHRGPYDCLIFGSSRATLLQPGSFNGYRCFNLAFSSGQVGDFIAFALYVRDTGLVSPRLIVFAIDGFGFYDEGRDVLEIPPFVLSGKQPAGMLSRSLNVDALDFSQRTLRREDIPRAYDAAFVGHVMDDTPEFRPAVTLAAEGLRCADDKWRQRRRFNPADSALYDEFRHVFPDARHIAYVPPINAWHIERPSLFGVLDSYLSALHACTRYFEEYWDSSIPSPITWNTRNTSDGSHYDEHVNHVIASAIFGAGGGTTGVRMNSLDLEDYRAAFRQVLERFHLAIGKPLLQRGEPAGEQDAQVTRPAYAAHHVTDLRREVSAR